MARVGGVHGVAAAAVTVKQMQKHGNNNNVR
jgi:hypothetical protein